MDNTVVNQNLMKNKDWTGPLRKQGVLDEGEFIYTLEANQSRMIESDIVNQLYVELIKGKRITGTGKENRRKAVACLINALFEAFFYSRKKETTRVGVLWRTATNVEKKTRYTARLFGESARAPAKDYLLENGFIDFYKGGKNPKSFMPGLVSLVVPTKKMEEFLNKVVMDKFTIKQADGADSELILLKDKSGQLMDYTNTEELDRQRNILKSMNDINADYLWSYDDHNGKEVLLHPLSLTLKRRFSYGDFNIYGRIHCDAQSLKKPSRRDLLIGDDETVELDFHCMMPVLAYAEAGLSEGIDAFRLNGDAYELPDYKRKTVKKAFSIAFNARSYASACKALAGEKDVHNYQHAARLLDRIIEKHKLIRHYFFSEAWKALNIHESNIMMTVLDSSRHSGVPVLPIHDGVVCRLQDRVRATQFMQFSFRERYSFIPIINEVRDTSGKSKRVYCDQRE